MLALEKSGVGCYIGLLFVGAFAYADDVVLLAPTVFALNKMLRVASTFSIDFMISFNASKSKLIIFGATGGFDIVIWFQGAALRPSPYMRCIWV